MHDAALISDRLPSDASALLRCYAALDCASREMLEAARSGDWDGVCRLEGACAVVIARLTELGREQRMPDHEQRERMQILRRIVERDAEIRRMCEPVPSWMEPAMQAPPSYLVH